MNNQTGKTTIRRRRANKGAQGQDAYIRMLDNATDSQGIRAALYAARGSEGVDMNALKERARIRRSQLQ